MLGFSPLLMVILCGASLALKFACAVANTQVHYICYGIFIAFSVAYGIIELFIFNLLFINKLI